MQKAWYFGGMLPQKCITRWGLHGEKAGKAAKVDGGQLYKKKSLCHQHDITLDSHLQTI